MTKKFAPSHDSKPEVTRRVIHIHQDAPTKPPVGESCNGCGVCCLAEPCPIGMVVSLKRTGPCSALQWCPDEKTYRCGLLSKIAPSAGWKQNFSPRDLTQKLARRLISAGSGCDCDYQVVASD